MNAGNHPAMVQCAAGSWCGVEFKIEGRLIHGLPEAMWQHLDAVHPLGCLIVRPKLTRYLQGQVEDDVLDERILMHLAGCEGCREARAAATAARTRGIIQALADLGMISRTQPG